MKVVSYVLVILLSFGAFADQCEVITDQQAKGAESLLKKGDSLISYCEPCNDPMSGIVEESESIIVESVVIQNIGDDKNNILINGKIYDLAYLFKHKYGDVYTNLSKMVKCPSDYVSAIREFK